MAVDVDKSGRYRQAGAVHRLAGRGVRQMPHGGNAALFDGNIRRKGGAAGTVDDGTAPQKCIKHKKDLDFTDVSMAQRQRYGEAGNTVIAGGGDGTAVPLYDLLGDG